MHLLRLSLDLQLDAMLLVLGASAAMTPEAGIPWRRWLDEDVELAHELTSTALVVKASLPASLGPDLANADPDVIADDLLMRYESMCGLLSDLLSRWVDSTPPWIVQVRQALGCCQERVVELRDHRHHRRMTAGAHHGRAEAGSSRHSQAYLPGELLG